MGSFRGEGRIKKAEKRRKEDRYDIVNVSNCMLGFRRAETFAKFPPRDI